MPNKEVEKQYTQLCKKHKLPGFSEADFELELESIEETSYLLRAIIRKINEKVDFYSHMLEEILQPDASNIYAIHENRFFDEEEKKNMYGLYVKLMNLIRSSVEVSLEPAEKNEAEFICRFFDEWKDLKAELKIYTKKMKDSWKPWADIKEDLEYLG
jgi:hypothetical protein